MRATGKAIAASLRPGDTVSIVTWNTSEQVVLDTYPVVGPNDPALLAKLDNLEVGGSAELLSALSGAYKPTPPTSRSSPATPTSTSSASASPSQRVVRRTTRPPRPPPDWPRP